MIGFEHLLQERHIYYNFHTFITIKHSGIRCDWENEAWGRKRTVEEEGEKKKLRSPKRSTTMR